MVYLINGLPEEIKEQITDAMNHSKDLCFKICHDFYKSLTKHNMNDKEIDFLKDAIEPPNTDTFIFYVLKHIIEASPYPRFAP